MEIARVLSSNNPVVIVTALKNELIQSVTRTNLAARQEHEKKLEELFEHFRNLMCGNFFIDSAKDVFDKFQLERELVEQGVLRYFIADLDRLSEHVCCVLISVFDHVITSYVYQTRYPLVAALETDTFLLSKLCAFVSHSSDTASTASAEILVACCVHLSLARKIVTLAPEDESSTTPLYIQLLGSVETSVNLSQICQVFKFLRALLLTHDEVAIHAFSASLSQLIDTFNKLLTGQCHYLARLKCLFLFGDLVQSRHLQPLVGAYTTSLDNLKIFYHWAKETNAPQRRQEFVKVFEILRLFFLNPASESNNELKNFVAENWLSVTTIIDQAEQVRSYTHDILKYPEYNDVRERVNKMANKEPSTTKSRRRLRSTESTDSIL